MFAVVPNVTPRLLLAAAAATFLPVVSAQQAPPTFQQRGGTFIEPPAQVDPVYTPHGPNRPMAAQDGADRAGLSLRLTFNLPLQSLSGVAGRGVQGSPPGSPTAQAQLRWTPWPGRAWFFQASVLRYLNASRQQAWEPDFTYAFGYEDWRPGTFMAVYSNESGNRFNPDAAGGGRRFNFNRGVWSVGYKFALPGVLEPMLLRGDGDASVCSARLLLTPRYVEAATGAEARNKTAAALGCRYTHTAGWFAHLTTFAYPRSGQQQPWDPDFTYGFGLAGGMLEPFTLEYGNYSGNRFPGRDRSPGQGSWRNGSVSLSWGTGW